MNVIRHNNEREKRIVMLLPGGFNGFENPESSLITQQKGVLPIARKGKLMSVIRLIEMF